RSGERRQALERVDALLQADRALMHPLQLLQGPANADARILELLERQTREPDPELRTRLTEAVAQRFPIQVNPATILGVTSGAYTVEGKPGYVILDARSSPKPVKLDMWFACWAQAADYPIRMTISDGVCECIEYAST